MQALKNSPKKFIFYFIHLFIITSGYFTYSERGMSWDPLNTAMDLFGELQELAKREREVDESYLQMAERCETFALELLQVKKF